MERSSNIGSGVGGVSVTIDATDRDMIERGDRIGAALVRELLAHYDEAESRVVGLEAALREIADEPDIHTKLNEVRLCCKFQDIAMRALQVVAPTTAGQT